MVRNTVTLSILLCAAAVGAYAQTPSKPSDVPAATAARPAGTNAADAKNLIGRKITNAQNETIGEIKSVYLSSEGKVDSVMVGVGGFLGMGEREVRLAWKDLHITNNGEKVSVNMTKDQLKAVPEYKYTDNSWQGRVFNDKGPYVDNQKAAAADARATTDRAVAANRTLNEDKAANAAVVSTGDFNATGDMSANALVGAKVRNANGDVVGKVEDLYLDSRGGTKILVVSVGGFLGIGSKDVAVNWSDIKYGRDGKSVVLTTGLSKDALVALPDYKYERRRPAEQAAAPK